jgi:hypothetical protein
MKVEKLDTQSENPTKLLSLLKDTTNSYKYLFLLALLRNLRQSNSREIPLLSLVADMLAMSWYPCTFFRINFGNQDQISSLIEEIKYSPSFSRLKNYQGNSLDKIRKNFLEILNNPEFETKSRNILLRYVPYRLLSPLFKKELKGKKDQAKNKLIFELASEYFSVGRALYKFTDDEQAIIPHDNWASYFRENEIFIESLIFWQFIRYLEPLNPGVPALSSKIIPNFKRQPLTKQRILWNKFIEKGRIKCIFSGDSIVEPGDYQLDHFFPWSLLAHNEIWNLIPISKSANQPKHNSVPSVKYLGEFVALQLLFLKHVR